MSRILLISKKKYDHFSRFVFHAHRMGHDFKIYTFDELGIDFTPKELSEIITFPDGEKITNFDILLYRGCSHNVEQEKIVSEICRVNNIPVIDEVFTDSTSWIDRKSQEYFRLKQSGLPIIPTLFGNMSYLFQHSQRFNFPFILKRTDESQGRGVYLIDNESEMFNNSEIDHTVPYLMQQYVENIGDVRVFIIGGSVIGAISRKSNSAGEFRNNVSLGGKAEVFNPSDYIKNLAIRSAEALHYNIAGVDLIQSSKSGEWYIMEVNRSPEFNGLSRSTDIDVHEKIINYLLEQIKVFK